GRDLAMGIQEGAFRCARGALDQHEGEIAAEDDAPLARKPVDQAPRERADAGDRGHAERDAGDEHAEPAHAAAQIAQRQTEGEPAVGNAERDRCHAITTAPPSTQTRAWARSASAADAPADKEPRATPPSARQPRRRARPMSAAPHRS